MKKPILALTLVALLALTGCSTGAGDADDSNVKPSAAPAASGEPSEEDEDATEEEEAAPDNGILAFGDVHTYEDGVSISVSAPTPFTPSESAMTGGQANQLLFTLVITNGSEEPLEPVTITQVSSGGVEGEAVYDSGNPAGEIGSSPSTVILPGQTVQWLEGWSLADPANITFQVAPSFDHDNAIFTNIQ